MKLYHGTAQALGTIIEREGFDPGGPRFVSPEYRKSKASEPSFVYFFEDIKLARIFGCGVAEKTVGDKAQIFAIETDDVYVEEDPLFPKGSWRHRGKISDDKLETVEIIECP